MKNGGQDQELKEGERERSKGGDKKRRREKYRTGFCYVLSVVIVWYTYEFDSLSHSWHKRWRTFFFNSSKSTLAQTWSLLMLPLLPHLSEHSVDWVRLLHKLKIPCPHFDKRRPNSLWHKHTVIKNFVLEKLLCLCIFTRKSALSTVTYGLIRFYIINVISNDTDI